jgi:thioredoxin 1
MEYITSLTPFELQKIQHQLSNEQVLIIKFGATWCAPCKIIKPVCDEWLKSAPSKIIWADIDIDESIELYGALKTKKMIKGVPTLFAFRGDMKNERTHWFIPDDSVSGADIKGLTDFFSRCIF